MQGDPHPPPRPSSWPVTLPGTLHNQMPSLSAFSCDCMAITVVRPARRGAARSRAAWVSQGDPEVARGNS